MEFLRNKYIWGLVLLTIISVVVFMKFGNWWIIGAIVFFFLYELMTIWIINKKRNTISSRQTINLFLGLKVGKIMLSVFFILIYAIAVKLEMKKFIMIFILLYFIYLIFDTLYLLSREKKQKTE